jgi:hypothetical protein
MSKAVHAFKQTDAARAMKAAQRAGLSNYRVEIERGKITVIVDNGVPSTSTQVEDAAALIP